MGINSASYLVLPKIIATILFSYTRYTKVFLSGIWRLDWRSQLELQQLILFLGLQTEFSPFLCLVLINQNLVFAYLIITSISAFYGYYTNGGT